MNQIAEHLWINIGKFLKFTYLHAGAHKCKIYPYMCDCLKELIIRYNEFFFTYNTHSHNEHLS